MCSQLAYVFSIRMTDQSSSSISSSFQVAILGYNHNNLAEPALNALNLYAKPL